MAFEAPGRAFSEQWCGTGNTWDLSHFSRGFSAELLLNIPTHHLELFPQYWIATAMLPHLEIGPIASFPRGRFFPGLHRTNEQTAPLSASFSRSRSNLLYLASESPDIVTRTRIENLEELDA